MTSVEEMEKMIEDEIQKRGQAGKLLASKFPELAGLSWIKFQEQCPLRLDFITACEMYDALNEEVSE